MRDATESIDWERVERGRPEQAPMHSEEAIHAATADMTDPTNDAPSIIETPRSSAPVKASTKNSTDPDIHSIIEHILGDEIAQRAREIASKHEFSEDSGAVLATAIALAINDTKIELHDIKNILVREKENERLSDEEKTPIAAFEQTIEAIHEATKLASGSIAGINSMLDELHEERKGLEELRNVIESEKQSLLLLAKMGDREQNKPKNRIPLRKYGIVAAEGIALLAAAYGAYIVFKMVF